MEETRNENIETTTELVPEDNSGMTENTSGKGSSVAALAVIGGLAVGATALWRKTKYIRREHAIKKLEKEGYAVIYPAEAEEVFDAEEVSEAETDKE